jgi:hypothetical protein
MEKELVPRMLQANIGQAYKTHLLETQHNTICVQKIQLTKKKYGLWYGKTNKEHNSEMGVFDNKWLRTASKKFSNNRTLHLQIREDDITTVNVHDPTKANDIKVSCNFHEEYKYTFNQ